MLIVKLKAGPFHVNIIVVYASISDADDEEFERFFDSLDELWKCCKSQEITIIMGDWNDKVGQDRTEKTVGSFGLGIRNNRGDRLVNWCIERRIWFNTWFKVYPWRRYTCTQPGDRVKIQIDFILVNERFRQAVKQSQTYPGAYVKPDHNPVIARVQLSLKRAHKPTAKKPFMLNTLSDNPNFKGDFKREVILNLKTEHQNVESRFENLTKTITEAAEHHIPKERGKTRSSGWMTMEIKRLFENQSLAKQNQSQYNLVHANKSKRSRKSG